MDNQSNEAVLVQSHLGMASLGVSSEGERSGVSSPSNASGSAEQGYMEGLLREREALLGSGMDLTRRLVNQEIERIQNGGKVTKNEDRKMSDVTKDKSIKLTVKVLVPVRDHPKFNFVGKLLGPKGNSLKRLQEETMTKMAILGRGSMRDKQKEEELRLSGDQKFNHLSEDLHVEVAAVAPPAEAHARIAYALTEIRRYLVPDYNDEIRQEQMREMQIINNTTTTPTSHSNDQPCVLNNTVGCSEEESCSPQSNGGDINHHSPTQKDGGINGRRVPPPAKIINSAASLPNTHPAFRGLPRTQTTIITSGTTGKDGSASKSRGSSQGRRSVLSLLTKARAIQQKEHEFMGVFHDMSSYSVYDHMGDLPIGEPAADDLSGRSAGSLKVTTSPNERSRFRHDPYPRIASST